MALVTIYNPGHPAVAATVALWNERKAALAEHIAECVTCTRQSPMRYRSCTEGRGLATAVVSAVTAVINVDAAVSAAPGEG